MILLDTCTLLWVSDFEASLPKAAKDLIRRTPPKQRFVSAISAFEIAVKHRKGHLELPMKPQAWLDATYAQRGLVSLPITDRIACKAASLPLLHKDPADRIIVATAMLNDLVIVTPDKSIRAYKGTKTRWH